MKKLYKIIIDQFIIIMFYLTYNLLFTISMCYIASSLGSWNVTSAVAFADSTWNCAGENPPCETCSSKVQKEPDNHHMDVLHM
jgi:hypothetical protein